LFLCKKHFFLLRDPTLFDEADTHETALCGKITRVQKTIVRFIHFICELTFKQEKRGTVLEKKSADAWSNSLVSFMSQRFSLFILFEIFALYTSLAKISIRLTSEMQSN
jgi:hypothetical protein